MAKRARAVHLTIDIENKSADVYGFIVGANNFPIRRNSRGLRVVVMQGQKLLLDEFLIDSVRFNEPVYLDTSEGKQLLVHFASYGGAIIAEPTKLYFGLLRAKNPNLARVLDCWFNYWSSEF